MSVLSKPYFHDEQAAFDFVEGVIWPEGPHCPHCGGTERITSVKPNPEKRVRYGLKRCGDCKKQFTVCMGTIFEESKLPLTKWLQAIYLMCASKKGVSAHQLHRTLEVTYKTAWFLAHRIREAMRSGDLTPFGQGGTPVEIDETYFGMDPDNRPWGKQKVRTAQKMKVLTLVDRATGQARSAVLDDVNLSQVRKVVEANLSREARMMTDEHLVYRSLGKGYAEHGTVNHSKDEYVSKADPTIHTNTIEGYFSIFKRGMRGTFQHCSKKHLHRYLAEFDFRYSNRAALGVDDEARAAAALKGVIGKRLTYKIPSVSA